MKVLDDQEAASAPQPVAPAPRHADAGGRAQASLNFTFAPGVAWLRDEDVKASLVLAEIADPSVVSHVTMNGYAPDLNEVELEKVGRNPFPISYAVIDPKKRCVVSFENSAPSKTRGNRKVPGVCQQLGVRCVKIFAVIDELDFTTDWKP